MTEEKIFANISAANYKILKEKFQSVNIDEIIEKKVKYYRAKPFEGREKLIWIAQIKEYLELVNEDYKEEKKDKKINTILQSYYSKKDLAQAIYNARPYFYDNSKLWWLWNEEDKRWQIVDDKDILNLVAENSDMNTVNSKEKNEILEAMEQYGRKAMPKQIKQTWIQFKDKIVDIKTGDEFEASPEYFVTNPIPWALHKERFVITPVMDKIFEEWVGEKYIKTLYEIIAYCLLPDYPIHRLFCFIGEGLNGKSKFLELVRRFVGEYNVTSTELDTLLSSRFEVTRLHKKLVCMMGETNFSEMSKTSIIKKLTGQDVIGFEYKGKNPFEGENYAKILISTNNLPTTTDKTIGFYRRWMIIDFPNRFSEKRDILADIPAEEYECLAVRCLGILKDLLDEKQFTNEGSIEERMKKYEDKSDPIEKFLKEFTEEGENNKIWKFEFEKKLNNWCKENKFRQFSEETIGRKMKEKGIEQRQINSDWLIEGQYKLLRAWIGIKWKEELTGSQE